MQEREVKKQKEKEEKERSGSTEILGSNLSFRNLNVTC